MKILMILNDPPYGTELVYNSLRRAMNLPTKHEDVEVSMFLMGATRSTMDELTELTVDADKVLVF